MCGIAGCLHDNGTRCEEWIGSQLARLRHRGPDSEGFACEEGCTIGQSRLAVIDLVTGDPPISNEDGSLTAVMNGEIYNFAALREDLTRRGHEFSTRCDTEVLVHLAEDLEPVELARRLEGMFAFALYDRRRRRLVLGRDRLGVKPLYWWRRDGSFVFGSESKAVLAHGGVERSLHAAVLPAYLSLGYAPSPHTFYEGISALPPAHVAVVQAGKDPVMHRYWSSPIQGETGHMPSSTSPTQGRAAQKEPPQSLREAAAEVRALLHAAVKRRLVSDVPLGTFLSGGIDSSAVVALMARESGEAVRTFTIGFEDADGYDERPYATLVAKRYKTDHTEFVVKPDATELVERLVEHYDGPFGDSSAMPTYLLSELTRRHVTVALCGDGGDEMFAGYERFAAALMVERLRSMPEPVGDTLAWLSRAAARRIDHRLVRRAARMLDERHLGARDAFFRWMSFVPPEWVARLLPGHGPVQSSQTYLAAWESCAPWATTLQHLQQANLDCYLLDDLLPKVDRMSMAHGLEVRSPFLDRELVEHALMLPDRFKVRGISLKRALKAAVADLLPPEILQRPKHGFGVPLDRWFRDELRGMLSWRIGSSSAAVRRYLDPGALDALVAEHLSGRADHGHALWTLLTLEVFLEREGW